MLCVIDYVMRDQFTFLAKVNIRVKSFSLCNLHLMEKVSLSNMSLNTDIFYRHLSATINPFAPGDFAEKRVLKLVEWFSGHCRAIKS